MGWIIFAIIMVVIVGLFIALYVVGNKMQKQQLAQREQMQAAAQPANLFIIDKKIMPMKDAKLPKAVMDQAPKRYQKAKIPVVKAKVGPQVMTLICDEGIFDDVPKHGEVKAMLSGIYIISVRAVHKQTRKATEEQASTRKKTFREKMLGKQADYQKQLDQELANRKAKEDEKKIKAEEKKKRERAKKIVD
jgi:hypothetical protein